MEEEKTVGLSKEEQADRRLTYLFLTLPYVSRIHIAAELQLVRDSDEGLLARESWPLWKERATQQGAMAALSLLVDRYYSFARIEEALFRYPEGGEALSEELKHVREMPEFLRWKNAR